MNMEMKVWDAKNEVQVHHKNVQMKAPVKLFFVILKLPIVAHAPHLLIFFYAPAQVLSTAQLLSCFSHFFRGHGIVCEKGKVNKYFSALNEFIVKIGTCQNDKERLKAKNYFSLHFE